MLKAKRKQPAKKVVVVRRKAKVKAKPVKPKRKRTMADKDKDLPTPDKKSGPGATPGTPEKDPKDKPETAAIPESPDYDPNEKKNTPPPHKQPRGGPNYIHNQDQDPNHPASRADMSARAPSDYRDAPVPYPTARKMTSEQEKEAAAGGDANAGVGPVTPAAYTTGPVETIDDQGIGPRTPYPTGNPPPSRENTTQSQGIWRGDEPDAPDSPNRRTKDDYHRGDTMADGPNRAENMRQREQDEAGRPRDTRPQGRIGGAQEMATPPKGRGT